MSTYVCMVCDFMGAFISGVTTLHCPDCNHEYIIEMGAVIPV